MNNSSEFETYLSISNKKFEIFLLDIKNYKNLYKEEFIFENSAEKINLNDLSEFLEKNIFKIEKLSGNFINNINIIIEDKSILDIDISLKKKNYSGNVNKLFLESMLTDIQDLFKENYSKYKLIHMIINKYIIEGKDYYSFQDKINSNEICLELKLISISNLNKLEIENTLKKYQIQVENYFDSNYLKNFFKDNNLEISKMAFKIKSCINQNEVNIVSKISKKQSFFVKFFKFFS